MRRRNYRLRGILALLVLATTVPLGLFAGLLIVMSSQQQHAVVDRQNVDTARAISTAIDKAVESAIDALAVFASVDDLLRRDIGSFRAFALRLIPRQPGWHAILLADPSGRLLMNTASPPGGPFAPPAVDWTGAAIRSNRPAVSDLFLDSDTGRYFVIVAVPVIEHGQLQFVLGAQMRSTAFSEVLKRQSVAPNGVVTLIDRTLHIIARTRGEDMYLGQLPAQGFRDAALRVSEGTWRSALLEGMPSYSALSRSSLTHWTVGIGQPAAQIDVPIWRSIWALTGVGAGILILGVAFALLLSQLIVRALRSAAQSAQALARGEPLLNRPSPVAEIEALSAGLRDAAAILAKRMHERDRAEEARSRASAEREQALLAEQAARREAEAANRSKDEFVATVSHELRTPLNAILGWVNLLRRGLDDARRERALDVIERNTLAQSKLIDDLLDMSRVITGNLRLNMQETDLGVVVNTAIDTIRPAAEAKQVVLAVPAMHPGAIVLGDPDRLQQLAWNLLTNSIKFTPAGGRVEVRVAVQGAEAVLTVSDTGIGIEADFLPHVFERFRQAASSEARSFGGLGIGLALVRHLAELHGGSVSAHSEGINRGARFVVRLPLRQPVMEALPASSGTAPADAGELPEHSLKGLRILVVDDDVDARELLETALAQSGAKVTLADSMRQALDCLDSAEFDVLLSDIAMPRGTGYDLVRAVRGSARTAGLPAVALTAYSGVEDRNRALSAGFNFHVGKPFELSVLIRTLALAAARKPDAGHAAAG